MEPHDLIVMTNPGITDPGLAIAAERAGARGVLDLEYTNDFPAISAALDRMTRFSPRSFGVNLGSQAAHLIKALPSQLDRVILSANDPDLAEHVRRFQHAGTELLIEAVTFAEAVRATALAPYGIILKGHEAGGRIGSDTSFILVQKWRQYSERQGLSLPYWVRGGIGLHTAAACQTAGARGIVLDSQLLLARESPLSDTARRRLAGLDGSETQVIGERIGLAVRLYSRPDCSAVQELVREEARLAETPLSVGEKLAAWQEAIRIRVAAGPEDGAWLIGQDLALAARLAASGVTVAGIIQTICQSANKLCALAATYNPVVEGSPLAVSHNTRYPILQGPMTRVSDTAAFANAVASAGGLPFLALALMRKTETQKLLAETEALLGSRPWGVGILGFVPNEIRAEQLDAIRTHKPPFAIIAGGRPDQAQELESQGIATYLHVPSPGLLRMFLKGGARRFIFEGQECGGHVGPRTSFALWQSMIEVLEEYLIGGKPGGDLHIVFAGGIHDRISAGMVATLAAGLSEKGVKIGVLIGTAYLFTREAVSAGAITERFQQAALTCGETVLLETGPGHAIRCIPTPYVETFADAKHKLRAEGKTPLEVGIALERMNLGRLRVASKGVERTSGTTNGIGLHHVPEEEQFQRGMYMIGQVAALRDTVTTSAELHADICTGVPSPQTELRLTSAELPPPPPCDVAIVGLSCFYPRAGNVWQYWENILAKQNAVIEIPASHWDWRAYYDPDPRAKDKMISKWGGFMDDVVFDPLKYGITPKSIPCIEPLQLLLLEAVNQALSDAGYLTRPFERERTCAILGVGGGGMPLSVSYGFRSCMPLMDSIPGIPIKSSKIVELGEGILPEWTEDSFPGILLNVAAGRVANRFNLGGPNMAIDAACGSSLAALYAGVNELNSGRSDVAIVMGGDAVQTPYAYVAFSKTHALSPKGRCRPFDAEADGIALAEGVGVAVLKRLADAERDGDRIYAVVKGVGASSDGRDKGLTAPRAEGQLRALHRAYGQARVSPARIGLIEAHGTGTVVGDQTEARAIGQLLRDAGGAPQSAAIGSVKSMIGHSKCAAGLAGLIKAAFALHHKILPPTLVETPNPKANLEGGPLYLNTEPRPWVHGAEFPRTAGVSAFGFGGTNFHTVLEEYTGDYLNHPNSGLRHWPAELIVWRRPDRATLQANLKHCRDAIAAGASPALAELAASVWQSSRSGQGQPTVALVATSLVDLKEKLDAVLDSLRKSTGTIADPRGIYFAENPSASAGSIAFLFPGQGSQYPDMLAQLAMAFHEVRSALDAADRTLGDELGKPLSRFIYPPSPFTPEQEAANRAELQRTEVAQPALAAASLGMLRLLEVLGIDADMFGGHSFGEYVALAAAGGMSDEELIRLAYRRGCVIKKAAASASGGMIAVFAKSEQIDAVLGEMPDVWLANRNSPAQSILAGTDAALAIATDKLVAAGIKAQRIAVACGFHSPLIASAKGPLSEALAEVSFRTLAKPVFSNTTAAAHTADGPSLGHLLAEHLVSPVRFTDEILAMHAAGARIFIEVGPQGVLTGLVSQILEGQPHLAVSTDLKSRSGLVQQAHLLGQLIVAGVPARLDRLFQGRNLQPFDLTTLDAETGKLKPAPSAWLVNGVRSRPINGPEPRLLGQTRSSEHVPSRPVVSESQPTLSPVPILTTPGPMPQRPVHSPSTAPRATMHTNDHRHTPSPSANGHARAPGGHSGAAEVMLRFQDVMARFLDTQRSVMLGYLGTEEAVHPPATGVVSTPKAHSNGQVAPSPANRLPTTSPEVKRPVSATPEVNEVVPPVAVTSDPSPGLGLATDRDSLLARLLDLVSERTGYPKEALSIDLDLEADLGIDSIKRVEILGTLAEGLGSTASGEQPKLEMEKLSVIKTLRGIADYVSSAVAESSPAEPSPNGTPTKAIANEFHPGAREGEVQRLVVRPIDAPLPFRPVVSPPSGTIVITDDGRGTARELADRLTELDVNVALVKMADAEPAQEGVLTADLGDSASVADLIARLHAKCGIISGLIHLLPLAESPPGEAEEARMRREVKGLYLLARGLEADLQVASQKGNAFLLAVTAMGGTMGYGGELPDDFFAGHGGIAGFTKCLAHEWPDVCVRVVDVSSETPATQLADILLSELGNRSGPCEVGRTERGRIALQVDPGPLETEGAPTLELHRDSTVLITGGARGITAKIALELARRYQPRLVLVGSSPLPEAEAASTVGLTSQAELKAALMKELGSSAKPAAVEAAYRRLIKNREIRDNLEAIRAAGATVDYRSLDVRDAEALGTLVDELNADNGITAVIHGAGVIEDKLLRDKTPESFDRVFNTKVNSALTLTRKLDSQRLRFFALFASITSRYGNRGQSDYAAANEVLSKLACELDRKWPGRVVSIAWGPWAEVGMVADLEKHLVARGLKLITTELGSRLAADELAYGRKGEPEVLVAGGSEQPVRTSNESLAAVGVE